VYLNPLTKKIHVGGIFCDLAKACDCVNHENLLAKLHFFGLQSMSKNWLKSFVTIRKQKVEVKPLNTTYNFFSNWGTLKWSSPRISSKASVVHNMYK